MNQSYNSNIDQDLVEEDSHWLPVGDLMAGLMFLFILALAVYMLNITNVIDDITKSNETRTKILNEIKVEMENEGYSQVFVNPNKGVLRLEQGILFNTGEADLLNSGKELLNVLSFVMYNVLTKPEYSGEVNTIFIEGHTDSDPVNFSVEFDSNWDLSAYRAINTWRFMRTSESRLDSLKNDIDEKMFSISGYADSRPVTSNDTEEGKRKNRRIDFRINMKPPPPPEDGIMNELENSIR